MLKRLADFFVTFSEIIMLKLLAHFFVTFSEIAMFSRLFVTFSEITMMIVEAISRLFCNNICSRGVGLLVGH